MIATLSGLFAERSPILSFSQLRRLSSPQTGKGQSRAYTLGLTDRVCSTDTRTKLSGSSISSTERGSRVGVYITSLRLINPRCTKLLTPRPCSNESVRSIPGRVVSSPPNTSLTIR